MFRSFLDTISDYVNLTFLLTFIITLFVVFLLFKSIDFRIWELYQVQANIVIEEHGRIFEDENDWVLYKLEKLKKELNYEY